MRFSTCGTISLSTALRDSITLCIVQWVFVEFIIIIYQKVFELCDIVTTFVKRIKSQNSSELKRNKTNMRSNELFGLKIPPNSGIAHKCRYAELRIMKLMMMR